MKHRLLFIFISSVATLASAEDLTPNPGFEAGAMNGGWTLFLPGEAKDKGCTVVDGPGRTGKGVVMDSAAFTRYGIATSMKIGGGDRYKISVWVKGDAEAEPQKGTAGVVVRCLFSDAKNMDEVTLGLANGKVAKAYDELEKANIPLPREWTKIEFLADAPEGTVSFNLFLMAWRAKGKIYWDDVTIEKIGRSPLSSGKQIASAPAEAPSPIQGDILAAYQAGKKEITIPPGTYRIPCPPTPAGQERWCIHLEYLTNFVINAEGVTFLFTDRYAASIDLYRCENVTFRGATLLRETPPFSQGHVEEVGANQLTIRIDKGYPKDIENSAAFDHLWINLFDPQTGLWRTELRAASTKDMERLGEDLFRVKVEPIRLANVPVEPGLRAAWRGQVFNDLRIFECRKMNIIGVTVMNGAGFCFGDAGGDGGNVYDHCQVRFAPKPAGAVDNPLFSSAADGFHSIDTRKGPSLLNCYFEGVADDAVNIHGTYGMVLEANANKIIVLRIAQTRNKLFCEPGDHVTFYDKDIILAGEAKVLERKVLTDYKTDFMPDGSFAAFRGRTRVGYIELTLDKEIPAQQGWLANVPELSGGGYVIRNTEVHGGVGRGFFVKGSDGLIENCTVEHTVRAAVEFNTETGIWSESDYARNCVVRSNVFRNVSLNRKTGFLRHPGSLTMFAYRGNNYIQSPGGHRNILIENNVFENNDGVNILICSALGVTIRNNLFLRPMQNACEFGKDKRANPHALIWLNQSAQIDIADNRILNAGTHLEKTVDATESATGSGFENGVKNFP